MALGATPASMVDLLRTVYQNRMTRMVPDRSVLLQIFKKHTRVIAEGDHISIPFHSQLGGSVGWSRTNRLPPADHQKVGRATFNHRMIGSQIEIDGTLMSRARTKQGAELRPLTLEINGTAQLIRNTFNWDLHRNGSGWKATPAGATASNTFTVANAAGLKSGMRIDVLKHADGTTAGGVVGAKVDVNGSTATVTLQSPNVLADYNDVQSNPATYGVYLHNSYGAAIFGLAAAISSTNPPSYVGNYGGVDRTLSANYHYCSPVHAAGGTPRVVSDLLMQNLMDDIHGRSGKTPTLILAPPCLWSGLGLLMVDQKRYGASYRMRGWIQTIEWAGLTIVKDHDCQADLMWFLDPDTFEFVQEDKGKWMDDDGAMLARVDGAVAYTAAWWQKAQLICHNPAANGCLADLKQAA